MILTFDLDHLRSYLAVADKLGEDALARLTLKLLLGASGGVVVLREGRRGVEVVREGSGRGNYRFSPISNSKSARLCEKCIL